MNFTSTEYRGSSSAGGGGNVATVEVVGDFSVVETMGEPSRDIPADDGIRARLLLGTGGVFVEYSRESRGGGRAVMESGGAYTVAMKSRDSRDDEGDCLAS